MAGVNPMAQFARVQYEAQYQAQLAQLHPYHWQQIKNLPPLGTPPQAPPSLPPDPVEPHDEGVSPFQQFDKQYEASFAGWDAQTGHKGYLNSQDVQHLLGDAPYDATLRTLQAFQEKATSHNGVDINFASDHLQVVSSDGGPSGPRPFTHPEVQNVLGSMHQDARDYSTFLHRYQQNFSGWDAMSGHKGHLDAMDVDTLMQNPNIKGDDAAALATVKGFMDQNSTVQLTRNGAFDKSEWGDANKNLFDGDTQHLGNSYVEHRTNVSNLSHELYAHGDPDWQSVHQKQGDDCFLESPLASMAKESPERVKNLIHDNKNGTYTVNFPGHDAVTVNQPTDAELSHYGNNGQDGTWAPVISKAYGAMRYREGSYVNESATGREPFDGAGTGTEAQAIRDLTGHDTRSYAMYERTADTPDGKPIAAASIDDVRQGLIDGLKPGRVAAAGSRKTDGAVTEDGLPSGHSFSVLGYDPKTDTISMRNPWGNAPLEHVQSDIKQEDNGIVHMPLSRFMKNFNVLDIEDPSRPAPPLPPPPEVPKPAAVVAPQNPFGLFPSKN